MTPVNHCTLKLHLMIPGSPFLWAFWLKPVQTFPLPFQYKLAPRSINDQNSRLPGFHSIGFLTGTSANFFFLPMYLGFT